MLHLDLILLLFLLCFMTASCLVHYTEMERLSRNEIDRQTAILEASRNYSLYFHFLGERGSRDSKTASVNLI